MQWFIRIIGVLAVGAGIFQFRRSLGFKRTLAEMNMETTRISIVLWLIRLGGFLSVILGIWMLLFLKA